MRDEMKWRVGSKVPINVYEGDTPVCQCQTVEYARRIVTAVNGAPELLAGTEAATSYAANRAGTTEELEAENAQLRKALEKIFGIAHSGSSISHLARVALAKAGRAPAEPLEPKA